MLFIISLYKLSLLQQVIILFNLVSCDCLNQSCKKGLTHQDNPPYLYFITNWVVKNCEKMIPPFWVGLVDHRTSDRSIKNIKNNFFFRNNFELTSFKNKQFKLKKKKKIPNPSFILSLILCVTLNFSFQRERVRKRGQLFCESERQKKETS